MLIIHCHSLVTSNSDVYLCYNVTVPTHCHSLVTSLEIITRATILPYSCTAIHSWQAIEIFSCATIIPYSYTAIHLWQAIEMFTYATMLPYSHTAYNAYYLCYNVAIFIHCRLQSDSSVNGTAIPYCQEVVVWQLCSFGRVHALRCGLVIIFIGKGSCTEMRSLTITVFIWKGSCTEMRSLIIIFIWKGLLFSFGRVHALRCVVW